LSLVDLLDAAAADPTLARLAPEWRYAALASTIPQFANALRARGPSREGRLRIMLRARERQSATQKQRLVAAVERIAREEFPEGAFVTGYYVLLADLVSSLLRDQWLSFALASGGIFLVMLVAYRSARLALLGLVPNALPILVVLGSMGWLAGLGWADVKLNMGAAMIAAVSMGLSVDGSLHYLFVYRRARLRGQSHLLALAAAQQSVGQAMILSTLALVLGFSVLLTSPFVPTIYFGALVALAMAGGLVGNLVLLPVLLAWTASGER
jgi:predicted RND superfamily exporter protein